MGAGGGLLYFTVELCKKVSEILGQKITGSYACIVMEFFKFD